MKVILSPAKKMKVDTDTFACQGMPALMKETEQIRDWICSLSYTEAKTMWACNDRIAEQNFERFRKMNLRQNLTPAILGYDGIQYTCMAPEVFEEDQLAYVQETVRILSGFYGVLRPLDGVAPYRLEMQAKAAIGGKKNLYEFWGRKLYEEVMDESRVVINLASKEYAQCIRSCLQAGDRFVSCLFGELEDGRIVQKGVYAKMARGDMTRYMAEHKISAPEQLKGFDWSGYSFRENLSSPEEYVFIREEIPGKLPSLRSGNSGQGAVEKKNKHRKEA